MSKSPESRLAALNAEVAAAVSAGVTARPSSVALAYYLFSYALNEISHARPAFSTEVLAKEAIPRVWAILDNYPMHLIDMHLRRVAGNHARWSQSGAQILAVTKTKRKFATFYISTKNKEAEI